MFPKKKKKKEKTSSLKQTIDTAYQIFKDLQERMLFHKIGMTEY